MLVYMAQGRLVREKDAWANISGVTIIRNVQMIAPDELTNLLSSK